MDHTFVSAKRVSFLKSWWKESLKAALIRAIAQYRPVFTAGGNSEADMATPDDINNDNTPTGKSNCIFSDFGHCLYPWIFQSIFYQIKKLGTVLKSAPHDNFETDLSFNIWKWIDWDIQG